MLSFFPGSGSASLRIQKVLHVGNGRTVSSTIERGKGRTYIGKAKEKLLELPKEPLSWRRNAMTALLAAALHSLASDTALPGTVPPCSDTSASGGSF